MRHLPTLLLVFLAVVWTGVHFDSFIPEYKKQPVEHGFDFSNVYHEEIEPFTVVGLDYKDKMIYIELDNELTLGSDGACQMAGMVILNIIDELPDGWMVYVTNAWVPSAKNPIDLAWAKVLAEGY